MGSKGRRSMQADKQQAIDGRAQRIVALAATLLANALLVWCLLHLDQQRNGPADTPGIHAASAALQVRWIDMPSPVRPTPVHAVRRPAPATTVTGPLAAPRLRRAPMATLPIVDTPGTVAVPSSSTPLDLSLQAPIHVPTDRYRRSLLDRPAAASMAAVPVIAVRMRDSSIGGLLGRMTGNSRCAELRAALRSADGMRLRVILDALQKHDCG